MSTRLHVPRKMDTRNRVNSVIWTIEKYETPIADNGIPEDYIPYGHFLPCIVLTDGTAEEGVSHHENESRTERPQE